ncbi:MAG: hypothetical protein GW783_03925 [Deltaproteobacteria bacterium]|nr:hypothetical protein [Deltaproteobacteria bacterium]NCP96974.1 hypothetical protein [Deltaproteobacteria bacterium]NCS73267.1 hypothetical protein [Deltaproteobacteria bacterium]
MSESLWGDGVTDSETPLETRQERHGWLVGPLLAVGGLAALAGGHAGWPAIVPLAVVAIGWTGVAYHREVAQRRQRRAARAAERALAELAHEFHTVLDRFTRCCTDQYGRGRGELQQLRRLLADAAARLIAGVERLHQQVQSQHALCANPADTAAGSGWGAPEADRLQIEAAVSETTTALQFEDLASQLICHVDDRLACLQALLDGIAAIDAQLPSSASDTAAMRTFYQGRLVQMQQAIAAAAALIERAEHVAVHQERLEAGEVELF